jgi:hypothetical protein
MQTKLTKHVGTQTWKKNTTSTIYFLVYFVNNDEGCITMAKGVAQFLRRNLENS